MPCPGRSSGLVRDLCYIAGLFLIAALFFLPAWQQPDGFWYPPDSEFSDLTYTHWPKMWLVQQTWQEHRQIPLWMPLIIGGTPFVGNPLAALFYPFNWLFLTLPIAGAFNLLFGLHLFLAGTLCYGLLRWSYRRTPFAAFVAGVGYMLSPKLLAHIGVGHVGWSQAFTWLPLALWLLRSALERRSAMRAAWCGAVLSLIYFADPRVMFYGVLMHAAYALCWLGGLWRKEGFAAAGTAAATLAAAKAAAVLRAALRLLPLPVAFILIGAAQMLPTIEMMSMVTRAALNLQEAGVSSLPWTYLLGFLLSDRGGFNEWMTYQGLAPLGLAILALVRGKDKDRWFWVGLIAFCLAYGLGVNAPLYPLIFRLLPGLGWVRVPSRILTLLPLAINVLAGSGVDNLFNMDWSPQAQRWAARIAFASVLLCAGVGIGLAVLLGKGMPVNAIVFSIVGAAAAVLLFLSTRIRSAWVLPLSLVVLLLVDLGSMGRSLMVLRSAQDVMSERRDIVQYLAEQKGLFRVYSPSYSIHHHVGALFGLQQLDGIEPSQLQWLAQYMALAGDYQLDGYAVTIPAFMPDDTEIRTTFSHAIPNAALLGLLNGRFVVADFPIDAPGLVLRTFIEPGYIYENEQTMPRAFTMTRAELADDWQDAQSRLAAGFDPAQGALVESDRALDGPPGWQEAQVVYFSPNRIVVEAQVERESLLVLGEVWCSGWRADVDGAGQPIYRVNGVARGVYIPGAGDMAQRHVITFTYRPASLWWGLGISIPSLIGLLAWSIYSVVRPRGATPGPSAAPCH